MKKFFTLLLFMLSFFTNAQAPFITTWEVTDGSLDITIPVPSSEYSYNYTVDFGDGTVITNVTSSISHNYASAGIYSVEISGVFPAIRIYDSEYNNQIKLKSIEQWGDIAWETMYRAFMRAYNLVINATDAPNLSQVTDLSYMFVHAESLNQSINNWDVSNVEDMSWMFESAITFNQPLDNWDVSNVTSMFRMFYGAVSFNQPIGNWDVSNVTSFGFMFSRDENLPSSYPGLTFNQPLDSWNTSSATNMDGMFYGTELFNQPLDNWNVSNVIWMNEMFHGAKAFNQSLNNWDTSNVVFMDRMFQGAINFNGDINNWNVSNITDMSYFFAQAESFNQPIGSWDVSGVTSMSGMFYGAILFNYPINDWDVSNVIQMNGMFEGAAGFNQPLDNWDVSNVESMTQMFKNALSFNSSINYWDLTNIEQDNFGNGISNMFEGAQAFNQSLDYWDITGLYSLAYLFKGATAFNQPLDNWDTSDITIMTSLFDGANAFDQPLDSWDVSNVTNMKDLFRDATSFNQSLNNWNTSMVESMSSMFRGATSFNQSLNNWDVSNVSWMNYMFNDASSFNQDLSSWDVSNVDYFRSMFENATSFNQDLSSWNFSEMNTNLTTYGLYDFLDNTNMSIENYDALLLHLTTYDFSASLGAEGLEYCDEVSVDYLENTKGWNINGHFLGNCNSISGSVYFDSNNDGCDLIDISASNMFVEFTNNTNQHVYSKYVSNGLYQGTLSGDNFQANLQGLPSYMSASPINEIITFQEGMDEQILDFCVTSNQSVEDLMITLLPLNQARPGFECYYQLLIENIGTEPISNAIIDFNFDSTKQSFISSEPSAYNAGLDNLQFNISNIEPFQTAIIDVTLQTNVPPLVNSGDILSFNTNVSYTGNDYSPNNNIYDLEQNVINSYDPNDIQVLQGSSITVEETGDYLDYIIRFQNTGDASAINVEVLSMIHDNLDLSTFKVTNSSHSFEVSIEQLFFNIVSFKFNNINLPDETSDPEGSNGFVAYRIKPKTNILVGEVMEGIAEIYFDFNTPIITNMVSTTVVDNLGIENLEKDNLVSIYPNPIENIIYVKSNLGVEISSVSILDLQGKVLINKEYSNDYINTNQLSSGVYLLSVVTNYGILNSKIIKK